MLVKAILKTMNTFNGIPIIEHYNCMVDLSKCFGKFDRDNMCLLQDWHHMGVFIYNPPTLYPFDTWTKMKGSIKMCACNPMPPKQRTPISTKLVIQARGTISVHAPNIIKEHKNFMFQGARVDIVKRLWACIYVLSIIWWYHCIQPLFNPYL